MLINLLFCMQLERTEMARVTTQAEKEGRSVTGAALRQSNHAAQTPPILIATSLEWQTRSISLQEHMVSCK